MSKNTRIACIVWVDKDYDSRSALYTAINQLKGVERIEVLVAKNSDDVVMIKAKDLINLVLDALMPKVIDE
jgi:hypothetical protein